jgi:cyclophilin family peptidyl-prolyl cis-trans isomerase
MHLGLSQFSLNDTNFLPDMPSNFSFMLQPNISNNAQTLDNENTQQTFNGSNLNDLTLLEDQVKLAQEKIARADLGSKDWKSYTSKNLGFTVKYPSDVALQKEGKVTRFDPYRDLKVGDINKDGFSISPSIYEVNASRLLDVVSQAKDSHLNMNLNNSYLMLVEDTTPMNVSGDPGYSYLISLINRALEKSTFVSNNTFVLHNDNVYRFVFVTETNLYNQTNPIFNHLLKSLLWSNSSSTAVSNSSLNSTVNLIRDQSSQNATNQTLSNDTAFLQTTQGPIKIQLYPELAPNHVKNFQDLARKGFYDGVIFHRIVPGFVIQAGDPNTKNASISRELWGSGGPGYTINEEFNNMSHERGVVSMARMPDPNSAGSQFFIVVNDSRFLDEQYTAFGKVIEGMETVDKIANVTTNSLDQPFDPNAVRIEKVYV